MHRMRLYVIIVTLFLASHEKFLFKELQMMTSQEEKKGDSECKTCFELYNILPFNCLLIDIRTTDEYNKCHIWKSKPFIITINDTKQSSNENTDTIQQLSNVFSAKSLKTKIMKRFIIISDIKRTDNTIYDFIYSLFKNVQSTDPNTKLYELYKLSQTVNDFYKHYPFYCIVDNDQNKAQYAYPNCILLNKLYLGTGQQATTYEIVNNLKISHILNVTQYVECIFSENNKKLKVKPIKYFQIEIDDVNNANIGIFFEDATKFINDALNENKDNENNNRVLVHCEMGVSRSSACVLAYLLKYKNMQLCDAYKLTKQCREIIHPNNGFFKQLVEFEKVLFNGKSTEDIIVKVFKLRDINMDQKVANLKMGLVQAINVKRNKVMNKKKKKKKSTVNVSTNALKT
eukprot:204725_1